MGTEELEEGLCKTWGSIYGWPRHWVVEWTVSVGVQTEEVGDLQDMMDLFAPVESRQVFEAVLQAKGLEAGLDAEDVERLSDGLRRVNLFGIAEMATWRARMLQLYACEGSLEEDLLAAMECGGASDREGAWRYVIRQTLRCCWILVENRRTRREREEMARARERRRHREADGDERRSSVVKRMRGAEEEVSASELGGATVAVGNAASAEGTTGILTGMAGGVDIAMAPSPHSPSGNEASGERLSCHGGRGEEAALAGEVIETGRTLCEAFRWALDASPTTGREAEFRRRGAGGQWQGRQTELRAGRRLRCSATKR